jgi:hypothetical protein
VSKFIAIDLAPDGIYMVAGTARGGEARIERALSWTDADGGEAPPLLGPDTARRIGEQIRDRLRAAGVANAPVLVSVGRGRVILKELRYPAVPPTEEPALVKFQAMKELSDSPDDVVLDYSPLANGAGDGQRRSMAVVIRKELFAAIQQMCAAANLRLVAVTPRPYAVAAGLMRAFAAGAVPGPELKSEAVAALLLGPAGGEFTVARAGDVTFTRDVPGPVASSEPMLLGEVRRNLTMYAGSAPGHPVQGLYVAEAAGGWAGRLRAALGIPVHAYDPLNGGAPEVPEPIRGRFAGAAGLLHAKAAGSLPINFAAPRQPVITKDPNQTRLIVAALAAVLLLAVGGLYGYLQLSAADDQLASLRRVKDDLDKEVKSMEPDAKRLDAATKWKARQVNWLDELFDNTDRFREASERLRPNQRMTASLFKGAALPPDTKTGKQLNQAKMDLKVSSNAIESVNAIVDSMRQRESKYYVGADKTHGSFTQGDASSKDYTIMARVNGRPPGEYTRFPSFVPPVRKYYPPTRAMLRESAPSPKEKPGAEDEG